MSWTAEVIERMRVAYDEGLSMTKIATILNTEFGTALTRNSIIGKVHRMGWATADSKRSIAGFRRSSAYNRPSKTKASEARAELRKGKGKTPLQLMLAGSAAKDTVEEFVIPVDQRKGLVDLEPGDCRWPIGDPQQADFHFCGRGKMAGVSYCEHHARRAYAAPTVRTGHTPGFYVRMGGTGQQRPMPAPARSKVDTEGVE